MRFRHLYGMAGDIHCYEAEVRWTGNLGRGTENYTAYARDHEIAGREKASSISCSSDPAFRGDRTRYNPEELFVASLSACHMLWVLHLCAEAGIVVTSYNDQASGTMVMTRDGSGQFTEVVLKPRMTISDPARIGDAVALHGRAHRMCFIAKSVRCSVLHVPEVTVG